MSPRRWARQRPSPGPNRLGQALQLEGDDDPLPDGRPRHTRLDVEARRFIDPERVGVRHYHPRLGLVLHYLGSFTGQDGATYILGRLIEQRFVTGFALGSDWSCRADLLRTLD